MALLPPEQEGGGRRWVGKGEGRALFSPSLRLLHHVGGQGGGHAASLPVSEWV